MNADDVVRCWERIGDGTKIALGTAGALSGIVVGASTVQAMLTVAGPGTVLAILVVPYWIPTLVAVVRRHPERGGIAVVNAFLGWTLFGWVVSLLRAFLDIAPRQEGVGVGSGPATDPRVGEVVDGHVFNGISWVAAPVLPRYRTGDAINS